MRDVLLLATLCGGVPVEVDPTTHDATVALLSHLPQVVSSGLAGRLVADDAAGQRLRLELSGPGLADTTRLAASSPELWTAILTSNGGRVAPHLRALAGDLLELAGALEALDLDPHDPTAGEALRSFLERGTTGRQHVPVKRGELSGAFSGVRVELVDEPGQLARLLVAAGDAGVNVEDLRVEHGPGRQRGVIELLVAPEQERRLRVALIGAGWQVFSTT
jgi:prephenate dehydrogenase